MSWFFFWDEEVTGDGSPGEPSNVWIWEDGTPVAWDDGELVELEDE